MNLNDCVHGYITASCTVCRSRTLDASCTTHQDDVASLRELTAALGSVHPSDLDTPNVLDHIGRMGQLAHTIYVRQRVAVCGAMFGLRTYRHRLFEVNWALQESIHWAHGNRTVRMGRPLQEGDFYHAVGNFSGVDYARADMGVPWMTREGIRECVPPAYTHFVGLQMRLWAL